MRVGSFVYATEQGLGYLAKSFYDHGVVTHPAIYPHGSRPNRYEWYPQGTPVIERQWFGQLHEWVKTLDVLLVFETPFVWELVNTARQNGVKTVFMPMHECTPRVVPATFDQWLCPSFTDYEAFKDQPNAVQVTVPVSVKWRQRDTAKTFVHNAGHGGLRFRNGTPELIDALEYVQSDAKIVINSQDKLPDHMLAKIDRARLSGKQVHYYIGTIPYENLWDDGDVFLFPEKFNGLSLPLQEAYAAGMCVMTSARVNNCWLPYKPLIPVSHYVPACISGAYRLFDEAVIDPKAIAAKIDEMYGQEIQHYSKLGRQYAGFNSWDVWGPKYLELLAK